MTRILTLALPLPLIMTQTYLNQPNPHPHPNPNPKSLTRQGPLAHALAAHLALAARPRRGALYPGAHGPGRGRVSELREGAAQSTQSAGADLAVLSTALRPTKTP